jgi:hypothetical protein
MKLAMIFMRGRRTRKPKPAVVRDWTANWSPRDWADLPPHHPRRPD